ncbi:hypothetical protein AOQ84DRAFT_394606 [Glonium stellatum]|uniref:DUF6697 domain-containing protein n=1 Tax=Glonium stellatum TaxID=574774 RepID=A0A8E2JYV5_9PEZI|nr:hypothetical protein AOQ84DRAFT_394606 [Glonium stellatum]
MNHLRAKVSTHKIEHGTWKPLAIRRFEPLSVKNLSRIPPSTKTVTFTWDFLRSAFGGSQWSPGLYYIPPSHGPCILPGRTYYALDATYEPYLPEQPGAHGAKLTAFFNINPGDVDGDDAGAAYSDVPLFICASPYSTEKNTRKYTYFGTYSQTRWSDKLDYDHMVEVVPNKVKMYWAEHLSETGRPEWVTEALKKHFWPKPEYAGATFGNGVSTGSVPNEDDERSKVLEDVEAYVNELKSWEKESSMKAKLLKKENILKAFEREDIADPPGLRLWWEYLQCVGWDDKFYTMLANMQRDSPHKG